MKIDKVIVCLISMLALAGCMTIFNARMEQLAIEDKASGEEVRKGKLTLTGCSLEDLVKFAMTNRPSMTVAALAVIDNRLRLKEIAADAPLVSYSPWTAPSIGLSGGYSASSETGKSLKWNTEGNASAGISLEVLIYDFGRNEALANEQIEHLISSEYELISMGYNVFEEVTSAYFSLMESDALLEVAVTNECEYALHLKQAEDRLQAGETHKLDVTRARFDLSHAREMTIAASNRVITAGATLMKSLGVDASRGTRDEVYPASGDALSKVMRGFRSTRYNIDDAFDLARTNAPAMAIARARLRASSRAVDYAIANLKPSVSAEVSINWMDPLWVWHWGVSAFESLFEGFRKTTAVDRAVVAMKSASAAVDETEQQLSLDIETAISVRDNAAKALETARVSVLAARENLNMVKARYLEGDASRVDFTDSVSDLATALGNRVSAFYAGQTAEARLFALMGQLPEYNEKVLMEK